MLYPSISTGRTPFWSSHLRKRRSPFASMKTCSTISSAKARAISAVSMPCCVRICSRRPSRKSAPDGRKRLPVLHEPARANARQAGDGPVVDGGPGFVGAAVARYRQHLPDIFGRFFKSLAAGLVHVEFAQQFGRPAQLKKFAEHDIISVIRQHQPRIMFYEIKPAPAARFAQEVRVCREQLRHRMIEAAHQRAVDEKVVGSHGL